MRICECGCGRVIEPIPRHRYQPPRFIRGHMPREAREKKRNNPRAYRPKPEEIPKGICECGCGQGPTGIAPCTRVGSRWFKGHHVPYLSGHSPKRLLHGPAHPNWRGRKRKDSKGYVIITKHGHPNADKQGHVPEHRFIMSQVLGRPLRTDETVHHINGNRADNRPENLQLHQHNHGNGLHLICLDCGSHNLGPIPI